MSEVSFQVPESCAKLSESIVKPYGWWQPEIRRSTVDRSVVDIPITVFYRFRDIQTGAWPWDV